MNTYIEKVETPLHQVLTANSGYDFDQLEECAEEYCKKTGKNVNILLLGIYLGSQIDKFSEFITEFKQLDDFTRVWSDYSLWLLGDKEHGVINYCKKFPECEKAIQDIISQHEVEEAPRNYDEIYKNKEWSAARSAAWSAAWSAAISTTESAASSAARSAASSAARSAVESAARSAARSAVRSAAESASYERQYYYLVDLFKQRVKQQETT